MFILVVVLIVLFVRWLMVSGRMERIENRIEEAEQRLNHTAQIAQLTARIHALEEMVKEPRAMARAAVVGEPQPAPTPEVRVPEPAPVTISPPETAIEPPPIPVAIEVERSVPSPPPLPEPPPVPRPEPALPPEIPVFAREAAEPEPVREPKSAKEWEAIVGGNWINKLGVFLLVVGIALLLGYGFTQTGPAGRAAIGVFVSAVMLGAGVFCERRPQYRIFGRGLLGGGWAALYFTTYAMQALVAARVIYDPWLGGVLLLAVATGMILHSLRYRSQTVTGLAYFLAFVTLAITPVTTLP